MDMRATALLLAGFFLAGTALTAIPGVHATPAPPAVDAKAVADRAFDGLTQGLATGTWDPFFDLLSDDFTFWFPTGKYLGEHKGKARAMEFFRYVSSAFPGGIKVVEVMRRSGGGNTFVYEFRDEGTLRGEPYKNRVAISLDVCGDKICGYREYFGSDGKIN
jgi:ketosteroid isomerase-like protein